ncbi:50S ribosomal protein L13 [Thermoflavifilum thermophilum]|uniref:Large ribosomal subunit protein uL13 n=1 Tax=Thermoflavifilum thermophilum TaxID=1393122 RepID=A0A1I7N8V9_9BACT|nr:50S ribosomal protein L13 [Thermoflavifilum thermophilum]SFV31134.1 LSU ribosomal protein L13P [Thermoflavifilum thermophilum]
MEKNTFKTISANAATVEHRWYVVDATNQTLGRLCSQIAAILRGKNKPYFTPHVDCGDYVIVINAEKVALTGKKWKTKEYISFTSYPGGQKKESAISLLHRRPEAVIERAVKGMLPKNRLGRQLFRKLFVYAGPEHPHQAQKPEPIQLLTK